MNAGEVRAIAKVDRIDGPSSWTVSGDCHMLILYEAGSYHWLETWLDGRRTSLGDPIPGEMWLAPFGHEYRATAQGGAVRSIEVEIPHHRLAVSPHARAIAGHDDPAMAALARALAAGDAQAGDALIAAIAERLATTATLPVQPGIARRIDDLMRYIQKGLETQLSVHELAEEAGMSVNNLIVQFARATGRTPAQYVLHQRLRRACWFLLNRPLSVAEIAFATGFSSHAHLCSVFRRRLAMSPGQWRKLMKGRASVDGEDQSVSGA